MEKGFGTIDISDNAIREIAFRSACSVLEITDEKKQKKLKKSIDIERTPEDNIIVSMKDRSALRQVFRRNRAEIDGAGETRH